MSQTLNPLFTDSNDTKYLAAAAINDKLVYQRLHDNKNQLWVYQSEQAESYELITLNESVHNNYRLDNYEFYFNVVDDELFYYNDRNDTNGSNIWVSDLSASGTSELPAIDGVDVVGPIVVKNNHVFSTSFTSFTNDNGDYVPFFKLVNIDNTGITEYPVKIRSAFNAINVCAFNPDNLIVIEDIENAYSIQQIRDGQVTEVLDLDIPPYSLNIKSMFVVNDNCFMVYNKNNAPTYEVIKITADGELSILSDIDEIANAGLYEMFEYKDRVYALGSGTTSSPEKTIQKLSIDYQSFESSYTPENQGTPNYFSNPLAGKGFLTIKTTYSSDPTFYQMTYFDSDLNVLENPFPGNATNFMQSPEIFEFNNQQLYLFKQDYFGKDHNLYFIDDKSQDVSVLRQRAVAIKEIFSDEQSNVGFVNTIDQTTQARKVYTIDDEPHINEQINGAWYDITRHNQGLMITKGTRPDGSEYIFVTIYTFYDGHPLWLAGSGEISPPQKNIIISIFEYSGIGTFEQNAIPTKEQYGTLTLEFNSCDTLSAIVSTNAETFELDLNRVGDVSFNNICSD